MEKIWKKLENEILKQGKEELLEFLEYLKEELEDGDYEPPSSCDEPDEEYFSGSSIEDEHFVFSVDSEGFHFIDDH